jgi:hypothetical protein
MCKKGARWQKICQPLLVVLGAFFKQQFSAVLLFRSGSGSGFRSGSGSGSRGGAGWLLVLYTIASHTYTSSIYRDSDLKAHTPQLLSSPFFEWKPPRHRRRPIHLHSSLSYELNASAAAQPTTVVPSLIQSSALASAVDQRPQPRRASTCV